jgi:hypothetical protein
VDTDRECPFGRDDYARRIAKETVQEMFLALGVDMTADGEVVQVQQDFAWVRSARTMHGRVRMHMITVLAGSMTLAFAAALWRMVSMAKAGG